MPTKHPSENLYAEVEDRLCPLAAALPPPAAGDWLAEHREKGQTFRQYLAANPVRRDLTTVYLCLVGDFRRPTRCYTETGATAGIAPAEPRPSRGCLPGECGPRRRGASPAPRLLPRCGDARSPAAAGRGSNPARR